MCFYWRISSHAFIRENQQPCAYMGESAAMCLYGRISCHLFIQENQLPFAYTGESAAKCLYGRISCQVLIRENQQLCAYMGESAAMCLYGRISCHALTRENQLPFAYTGEYGSDRTCFLAYFTQCRVKDTINPLQLFIFTNVIRCSRLPIWVGCFIYFKFTRVISIVYQSLHL